MNIQTKSGKRIEIAIDAESSVGDMTVYDISDGTRRFKISEAWFEPPEDSTVNHSIELYDAAEERPWEQHTDCDSLREAIETFAGEAVLDEYFVEVAGKCGAEECGCFVFALDRALQDEVEAKYPETSLFG